MAVTAVRISASCAGFNLLVPMGYRRNKFVETIGAGTKRKTGIHPSPWMYRNGKLIPVLALEALRVARG
jgi:hypothetical protein